MVATELPKVQLLKWKPFSKTFTVPNVCTLRELKFTMQTINRFNETAGPRPSAERDIGCTGFTDRIW
jgi:hypothetical protein